MTNTNQETVKKVYKFVSKIIYLRDNVSLNCFVLVLIHWFCVHFEKYTCTCKTQLFILYDVYILYMYCGLEA